MLCLNTKTVKIKHLIIHCLILLCNNNILSILNVLDNIFRFSDHFAFVNIFWFKVQKTKCQIGHALISKEIEREIRMNVSAFKRERELKVLIFIIMSFLQIFG